MTKILDNEIPYLARCQTWGDLRCHTQCQDVYLQTIQKLQRFLNRGVACLCLSLVTKTLVKGKEKFIIEK